MLEKTEKEREKTTGVEECVTVIKGLPEAMKISKRWTEVLEG